MKTAAARPSGYQEILRRLAIIDEGSVDDQAGRGLGVPGAWVLDPKTGALVRVGALAAIGSPPVCLEWSTTRALAAARTALAWPRALAKPRTGTTLANAWIQDQMVSPAVP